MFEIIKKKKKIEVHSPVNGKMIPIENVADKVFAEKLLGDGAAFINNENTVYAPCSGKIIMTAETGYAVGIELKNKAEILIHVGMNTVELGGKGLKLHVEQGDRVEQGDPILTFDIAVMKEKGIDLTTPMIFTNSSEYDLEWKCGNGSVDLSKSIVIVSKKS